MVFNKRGRHMGSDIQMVERAQEPPPGFFYDRFAWSCFLYADSTEEALTFLDIIGLTVEQAQRGRALHGERVTEEARR